MAITFSADAGPLADEVSVVREAVSTLFKQAFATGDDVPELNTEPETPAGQIIDGLTALLMEKDNELLYLANMFNPATSEGVWQDAMASIYFITRNIAEATTVTCTCTGLKNTVIPQYSVVQDIYGNQFQSTSVGTIGEDSTVDIVFRCVEYGAIEVAEETVTKIVTVIPGWDSVTNKTAGVTGRAAESQADFEARRRQCVAKNAHGTGDSVLGTIYDLDDVITASLIQNRGCDPITEYGVEIAPHSIYLSVYGGDADKIAEALYNKLDAGCGTCGNTKISYEDDMGTIHYFYIEIPETVAMGVNVYIRKSDGLPADYEEKVKAAVLANFEGNSSYPRVRQCETEFASRFYADVIASGVEDVEKIKLVYPLDSGVECDSVEVPADELPVLDESDITVTLVS